MSDFVYGSISGIAQTLIGHPFDTYKVLLQSNMYTGKLSPSILTKGITFPLLSSSVICGINFGSYRFLRENNYNPASAGVLSGIIVSPIVHLSDTCKISRQLGINKKWRLLIIDHNKGWMATVARVSIAYGLYFKTFEECKERGVHPFIGGAAAGLVSCTPAYPFDTIRSRQLAYKCSIIDSIKKGNIWKGYITCAIRSVAVNSVGFYVYDKLKDIFD
jgi:hypothetical protein